MKLLSRLSSLLKDGQDDQWSSTRFTLLFTVLLSNLCIFGVWVFICIHNKELIVIPNEIITIYSLANGITLSGKLIQTRHELKYSKKDDESKTDSDETKSDK